MSFGGLSHRPQTARSVTLESNKTKKPKARRRPSWDSSVNDLTVFKATPEEMDRRKAVHRSQNVELVKEDKLKKKIAQARQRNHLEAAGAIQGPSALLREILFNNSQLEETLAKSDALMSLVRPILSDDNKRIQGLPLVTRAPSNTRNKKSVRKTNDLFAEPVSVLDELSDSVMDKQALNEAELSWSSSEHDEKESSTLSYQPQMDLSRFQRLIQEYETEKSSSHGSRNTDSSVVQLFTNKSKKHADNGQNEKTIIKNGRNLETPSVTPQKEAAINDTAKVIRTRAKIDQRMTMTDAAPTMEDFNRVLEGLNNNLADYEMQLGRTMETMTPLPTTSYSGYTMALLNAVAKMSRYFKVNGDQLKAETVMRDKLLKEIERLSGLTDALTAEVLATQEAYARLQNEFVKHRRETDQQLLAFQKALSYHGIDLPFQSTQPLPTQRSTFSTLPTEELHNGPVICHQNDPRLNSLDEIPDACADLAHGSFFQMPATQATLLLPPQQKDSPSVASGRQIHHISRNLDDVCSNLQFDSKPEQIYAQQPHGKSLLSQKSTLSLSSQTSLSSAGPDPSLQQQFNSLSVNFRNDMEQQYKHERRPDLQLAITAPKRSAINNNPAVDQTLALRGKQMLERPNVHQQLAELNRQEAEAQRKLQELIIRQQNEVKAGKAHNAVSPPISPITVESDVSVPGLRRNANPIQQSRTRSEDSNSLVQDINHPSSKETIQSFQSKSSIFANSGKPTRAIQVMMPQASAAHETENPPTFHQGSAPLRNFNTGSAHMVSKMVHGKPQNTKNGEFLALSSHISS